MKKLTIKTLVLTLLLAFSYTLSAQTKGGIEEQKAAITALLNKGDCDGAQAKYNKLKVTGNNFPDIEKHIADCKKNKSANTTPSTTKPDTKPSQKPTPKPAPKPTLDVTPQTLSFAANGGSKTVTVNASSGKWNKPYSQENWVTLATKGNTITVKVSANTKPQQRSTSFKVVSGSLSKTVSITQDGAKKQIPEPAKPSKGGKTTNTPAIPTDNKQKPSGGSNTTIQTSRKETSLSLSSYSESFKAEGESKTITVNASEWWVTAGKTAGSTTAEWYIGTQPDASWVSYTKDGDRLTIKVSPNQKTTKRTDYFTVKCGDKEKRFDITQAAATPTTPPATSNSAQTFTVKGVTFKMIRVQGGTFTMGCTSEQGSDCDNDESPAHNVTLSDYYIGQTEVTQALWGAVMGGNPSTYEGDNRPVEQVNWYDAVEFCNKLSSALGLRPYYSINKSVQDPNNSNSYDEKKYIVTINSGANGFRLPTEAEWEYAARGGNKTNRYKYAGSDNIDYVAWYSDNSGNKTHPVKTKNANELGIYDMSGNVWEWCQDWRGSYSGSSQTNPKGPSTGSSRVGRGGSWFPRAGGCRVSYRGSNTPDDRSHLIGFRLAL